MEWWQEATFYQVYPRSFQDSNGDGIGDIQGIIQRLDYLKALGVEALWLTPMYVSPGHDNGYDIADYYQIDPVFGTMADFEALLAAAHDCQIRIVMDMVVNHTSDQHHWFKEALKSKDNAYHDYYIWRDASPEKAPNNWVSKFSGSAWEYVPHLKQSYLHLYDRTMPDLNWRNTKMQSAIYKMMTFWAEKGIDGFRLDVINNISKVKSLPDDTFKTPSDDGRNFYTNGPHVHEYLHTMNQKVFTPFQLITVGELSSTSIAQAVEYTNPKREELSMAFTFHHVKVDYQQGKKWTLSKFRLSDLKKVLSDWQVGMAAGNGWNALFWTNHDQPRAISRFADDQEYRTESAKLLALIEFGLRGTPYIYQGEEIAMKNAYFTEIGQYQDPESINAYHHLLAQGTTKEMALKILQQKSRENSRLPMQWDETDYAGFTTGTPWLQPLVIDHRTVASDQVSNQSVFYFYQQLIKLRKQVPTLVKGDYKLLAAADERYYQYQRTYQGTTIQVIGNFTATTIAIEIEPNFSVLIANYDKVIVNQDKLTLRPYEAMMLQYQERNE